MRRPFPGPHEAVDLDVEELARCILDRLVCTPPHQRGALMTRKGFIDHHLSDVYSRACRELQPRGVIAYSFGTAVNAFPEFARALTEAWSFLETQGYLVPEPDSSSRVFVGRRGTRRHADYRGVHISTSDQKAWPTAPALEVSSPPADMPDGQSRQAKGMSSARPPTAAVLWAHADPEWKDHEEWVWQRTVLSFTHLLRACAIDADLDLFHGHTATDWARFGANAIRHSDYVLVVASRTWRRAWEGDLEPGESAGVLGEANTLRGLLQSGPHQFLERVIPVVLPGREEADLPIDLKATSDWEPVPTLDERGIERLVRRMTRQPAHPKPALGPFRPLPPQTPVTAPAESWRPEDARTECERDIKHQIDRADSALAGMPRTWSASGEEPWDQARDSIEARKQALLRELAQLEGRDPYGPGYG